MLDPDVSFVEYSMERYEHRISDQSQPFGNVFRPRGFMDRYHEEEYLAAEEPHELDLQQPKRSVLGSVKPIFSCSSTTSTASHSSAASTKSSSSADSSNCSDNELDQPAPPPPPNSSSSQRERMASLMRRINQNMDPDPEEGSHLRRTSQFSKTRSKDSYMHHYHDVRPKVPSLADEALSLALFKEPGDGAEMEALRAEVAELSEDKRILLADNSSLEKEKRALEAALAKARRDLEDAAMAMVEKISPAATRTLADSDVQRLCNLSRLLGDENSRLRAQSRDAESEVRMLKEELGELHSANNRLSIELSSAKAQKEVLEAEIERLKEAVSKAAREAEQARGKVGEEAEGARRTIEALREEEKRLIGENVKLEREVATVLESLEEFEDRQALLRGEKQRATAEASRLEAELASVLSRAAVEAEARRKLLERAERAEAAALELRQDTADARFQLQKVGRELEAEKAGKEAALQEMALLRLRERVLSQDLKQMRHSAAAEFGTSTAVTTSSSSAGPLLLLPPPTSALDSQLTSWLNERTDLQAVDGELRGQIQKLATGFSESLRDMEDELLKWKDITAHLELALDQARDRGALCERNGRRILADIYPPPPPPSFPPAFSSRNALHAAAASGALAGFGLLAYVKLKQHMAANS